MMYIVIIAQYIDCTPCVFGLRQKVRSVAHPRAAILHFELMKRIIFLEYNRNILK